MKKNIIFIVLIFSNINANAQELTQKISRDSLLQLATKEMSEGKKKAFLEAYYSSDDDNKELLLVMGLMPRSSKAKLIQNMDSNYAQIAHLKTTFLKMLPPNTEVFIEFAPANEIFNTKGTIDFSIRQTLNKEIKYNKEWHLELNSEKLNEMLAKIQWNNETLMKIKALLAAAHCISIENENNVLSIGFARSGLGEYGYKLLDTPFVDMKESLKAYYNNGCNYIFYKQNIILEYMSGAVGGICFPDR
jgi:hypothetical protein